MDSIEIPSEDDGSLLLTTLAAQFPGACGLKYKSESGTYRGIRFADGVMYPPDDQWGNYHYVVVFPKSKFMCLFICFLVRINKLTQLLNSLVRTFIKVTVQLGPLHQARN